MLRACELIQDQKRVLILQPTKELINRTVETELLAQRKPPDIGSSIRTRPTGSVAGAMNRSWKIKN